MKKRVLLFSFIFLLFNLLVIFARVLPGLAHGKFSPAQESHNLMQWLQFCGDTLLYYLLALGIYLLLCNYHPQKKYTSAFAMFFVICTVSFFLGLSWTRLFNDVPIRMSRYFRLVAIPTGVQVFFAIAFYLIRYTQHKEVQQAALQLQNQKAELSFLRSQVNPHFLFNNLNNIYALVYEQSPQALPAIAGLSELLRYMLYNNSEMVLLKTELGYIEKYIALQQLRFEQPSCIEMLLHCSGEHVKIAPLLLIPFVENAFKHGQAATDKPWLKLEINSDENTLNFSCANLIGNKKKDKAGGIGLDNVKQRLNLLYRGNHQLEIAEYDSWFTIKLQLHYGR